MQGRVTSSKAGSAADKAPVDQVIISQGGAHIVSNVHITLKPCRISPE